MNYSAEKMEILPFGVTWMDLDCIILTEVSQRNTAIVRSYSYVESNKLKS